MDWETYFERKAERAARRAKEPIIVYKTVEVYRPTKRARRVYWLTIAASCLVLLIPPSVNTARDHDLFGHRGYHTTHTAGTTFIAATSCPPAKVILSECDPAAYIIDHLIGDEPHPPSVELSEDDRIRNLVL